MMWPRALLLGLLAAALLTAEEGVVAIPGLPPVPNPYGFDERLALRTYLEDRFHQQDLAGRDYDALVALYRSLLAPAVPPAPATAPERPPRPRDEDAGAEAIRRENIILQLRRQFHAEVDADATTDELDRQLRACVAGDRRVQRAAPAAPAAADVAAAELSPTPDGGTITTATAVELVPAALDLAALAKPAGVVGGLVVDNQGDRLVGVCFNSSLAEHLPAILAHAAGSMAKARQARTCLVLLGHGDGISIGMGENPVNLTDHLKANRRSYHALLGVEAIDCVAILSCSREADSQFTAFRDGLGYYPTWRVSSWEHTYQNAISGLAALQLALTQDRGASFRAAVFYDAGGRVASLSEVGQRTSTTYFDIAQTATGLALVPARRR